MDSAFGTFSTSARDQPADLSASTAPDRRPLGEGPAPLTLLLPVATCSQLFVLLSVLQPLLSVLY